MLHQLQTSFSRHNFLQPSNITINFNLKKLPNSNQLTLFFINYTKFQLQKNKKLTPCINYTAFQHQKPQNSTKNTKPIKKGTRRQSQKLPLWRRTNTPKHEKQPARKAESQSATISSLLDSKKIQLQKGGGFFRREAVLFLPPPTKQH
jgi:hypothetical protein